MEKYVVGFVTNNGLFKNIEVAVDNSFFLEETIVSIINSVLNAREEMDIKTVSYIDYIMEDE
ncbi:MAG: hypothetical protein MJZ20_11545 [Bacteroidaceae bacterium]|nr:hypothetical protein [Bacteroidaceae bacterium]